MIPTFPVRRDERSRCDRERETDEDAVEEMPCSGWRGHPRHGSLDRYRVQRPCAVIKRVKRALLRKPRSRMLLGLLRRQQRQSRVLSGAARVQGVAGASAARASEPQLGEDDDNPEFELQSWLALALWRKYKSTSFRRLDSQSLVRRKISQSSARRYVSRFYSRCSTHLRVNGRFCGGI